MIYCIVNMLLIIYIVILNFLIFNGFQDLQSCQKHHNIRLTIDTLEDFSVAQRIYRDLQEKRVEISIEVIVDYVRRHAEYIQLMKQQIKKNSK